MNQQFVTGLAMAANAHLVGLRARAGQHGGFLAEQGGHGFFEPVDGGVFGVHVVADFGSGDGGPHGRGGPGLCITAKVVQQGHDGVTGGKRHCGPD